MTRANKLLHPDIQAFIDDNLQSDVAQLALKKSPFPEIPMREIATQVSGKQTAKKKLPTWFRAENILYPKKLNLEQASSETTAKYKTNLVEGNRLIDLTGGFGVDAFFFSKKIGQVTHCETNEELIEMAEHNFHQLTSRKNCHFHCGNGIEYLKNTSSKFDWAYLDPSRRSETGSKVFRLEDCQPNVIEELPLLFEKNRNILLKTSPLLDLSLGISALKNVREIHVVAVSNETKELLWVLSSERPPEKTAIKTIHFHRSGTEVFEGVFEAEKTARASYSEPHRFLYEPNAAVMKSGLFQSLSEKMGIQKLHPSSHLYTSVERRDFPGRVFEIVRQFPFKPKMLKKELRCEKLHVATRNFPKTAEQLKKQFGWRDGGDQYVFFTTGPSGKKIVLICRKTRD